MLIKRPYGWVIYMAAKLTRVHNHMAGCLTRPKKCTSTYFAYFRLEEVKNYNHEIIEKLNKLKEENEKYRPKKINKFTLLSSVVNEKKDVENSSKTLIPGRFMNN